MVVETFGDGISNAFPVYEYFEETYIGLKNVNGSKSSSIPQSCLEYFPSSDSRINQDTKNGWGMASWIFIEALKTVQASVEYKQDNNVWLWNFVLKKGLEIPATYTTWHKILNVADQ